MESEEEGVRMQQVEQIRQGELHCRGGDMHNSQHGELVAK